MQAVEDAQAGREPAAPPVPPAEAGQEAVVAAVLASAYAQMDQDRKSTALKALQACYHCSSIKLSPCVLEQSLLVELAQTPVQRLSSRWEVV